MKNAEIIDYYYGAVAALDLSVPCIKMRHALLKNEKKTKKELQHFQELFKLPEACEKLEKKRIALAEKYAKKDDEGNPKIVGNSFILKDSDAFKKDFEKLKKDMPEAGKLYDEHEAARKKYLNEESEVELHMVWIEDVHDDYSPVLEAVMLMISDEPLQKAG
ncbi:MAG: hypothetical protein JXR07_20015 [Reichenbachiella sp.]